jgi:hypothetical protein
MGERKKGRQLEDKEIREGEAKQSMYMGEWKKRRRLEEKEIREGDE